MKLPTISSFLNIELNTPQKTDELPKNDTKDNSKTQQEPIKKVYEPKKVILKWTAPDREKYSFGNKKLSRSMVIIAMFFGILFIVMGEYFLILLIMSIIFVYYALDKTPEQMVVHEINSQGILHAGEQYNWEKLESFFFKNDKLLCIDTYLPLPRRLFLLVDEDNKKAIIEHLEKHMPYVVNPEKSSLDKAYDAVVNSLNK